MTKIDIFSGFLGAGKTTLIKKLLKEALGGEKVVLIENEFGEIGIDGGFMKEAGIQVTEMNSGCICCSLVGDFGKALRQVIDTYHPDRILIEPSGVGKLSDVIRAVEGVEKDLPEASMGSFVTVADATKCRMYVKNFGEFFLNQIEYAGTILLSRTQKLTQEKLEAVVALLREHNAKARIITTPWEELTGEQILSAMQKDHSLAEEMLAAVMAQREEAHAHHPHEHDHQEHHDHEHDHGHEHDHEHHEDGHGACSCGHHDHDHEDGHGACSCGHHHHGHDADEVFTSWGVETVRAFGEQELAGMLARLEEERFGLVLRAKGIVPCRDGGWLHFDYTPGEQDVRRGPADFTGRLCVIGSKLSETELSKLFDVA
ncbi:MAG TPA: GTP-binding protein [Candidatus Ventricola intestinavium]|nr:GTP-binding protein [Candidatus Ventricola intestinavium]